MRVRRRMVVKYGRSVSRGLSEVGLKALLLRLTVLGERLMHREVLYRLSMVLALAGSAAKSSLGQTASTSPVKGKTAAEAYQNVQVLKDIPADQLVPAMQFITYSLGVECSYCHVEGALEKDEKKPKQTARKMMQMMAGINRDNFESKQMVTCNSCHRGSPRPISIPIVTESGPKLPFESAPAEDNAAIDAPPADQIIAKYLDTIGGAAALAKVITREEKGTINISGRTLPIEILTKIGNKRLTVIHLPNGDSITAYEGASGWTSAPNRPVFEIPSVEVRSSQAAVDLQLPLHVNQFFDEVKVAAPEK